MNDDSLVDPWVQRALKAEAEAKNHAENAHELAGELAQVREERDKLHAAYARLVERLRLATPKSLMEVTEASIKYDPQWAVQPPPEEEPKRRWGHEGEVLPP